MQSRIRKPRRSFDNYGNAIEKQLNDDFQVYQYLNLNNIEGENIEEYIKLLNSLLVQKNRKRKTVQSLHVNFQQMAFDNVEQSLQSSKIQTWGGAKQHYTKQYEKIQIQTSNQVQVKNNLWKEIVQTKKSLNLLKGDIGHLVSRNQAAKLLQSKMNKAKIVADDQYKRVSMAFIKDKEQIKLRSQMQKKFNKKLNNVSMYQDTTLIKCKKNYLDSMIKKKQIFDRLSYIEKISSSINQSGELQRQKNLKNKRTLEQFQFLLKITKLIEKVPQVQKDLSYTAQSIHQFALWLKNQQNYSVKLSQLPHEQTIIKSTRKIKINSIYTPSLNHQDLQIITQQALSNFLQIILKQYNRVSQEIEKNISIYDQQMKKNEEFLNKIQNYEIQQQQILNSFSIDVQSEYQIKKQERILFKQKLKKFINFLKVIFTLLEYLQKNLNYSNSHSSLQMKKISSDDSQNQKSLLDLNSRLVMTQNGKQSRSILVTQNNIKNSYQKSYISQLHKNYYTLLFNDTQCLNHNLEEINQNIYQDLNEDLYTWFGMLKDHFIDGKIIKYPSLIKKQETTHKKLRLRKQSSKILLRNNSMMKNKSEHKCETEEEDIKIQQRYNDETYKRCHTIYKQDGINRVPSYSKASSISSHSKVRSKNQSIYRKSAHNFGTSSLINVNKLKNQQITYKKAQRIQLLQDIDKDYYKMLKSTIKMQKQNTRKNYEFLRTFKRAKYSSRDQILQQKRFESSYSMLFSNKRASDSFKLQNKLKVKKSGFYKAEHQQQKMKNRISKLTNQVRKSLYSSQVLKNQTQNLDQLKQNIKKLNQAKEKDSQKGNNKKQKLSIKLKDVLNLV